MDSESWWKHCGYKTEKEYQKELFDLLQKVLNNFFNRPKKSVIPNDELYCVKLPMDFIIKAWMTQNPLI